MSEPAEDLTTTEAPAKPVKRKAKHRRRATPRREAEVVPFKAPEEFAGMTATQCCDDCSAGRFDAEAAQRRLNEIERAYPRQPSQIPGNPTVMEEDAEWLKRNPEVADEFRCLTGTLKGRCIISGGVCAHPLKSPLQPTMFGNREVFERYQRAKKVLAHQRIDAMGR